MSSWVSLKTLSENDVSSTAISSRTDYLENEQLTFVGVSGGEVYFVVALVRLVVLTLLVSGGGVYLLVELVFLMLLVVLTVVLGELVGSGHPEGH